MPINSWLIYVYALTAATTAIAGVLDPDNPFAGFIPSVVCTMCCVSFALMQAFSGIGVRRFIVSAMLFAIYVTIYFPFAVLSAWPELYDEPRQGQEVMLLRDVSTDVHVQSLLFTLGVALAFWLGARFMPANLANQAPATEPDENADLFHARFRFVWVTGAMFLVQIAMGATLGTRDANERGRFGLFTRLLPVEALLALCLFVAVRYRKHIEPRFRNWLAVLCMLGVAHAFQGGVRGILLYVPMTALFALYYSSPDAHIRKRSVLLAVLIFIIVMPFGLAVMSEAKNVAVDASRFGRPTFTFSGVLERLTDHPWRQVFTWLGGRVSGYQVFLRTRTAVLGELLSYISVVDVMKSTLTQILPDLFLPHSFTNTLPIGKIASMVLDGHAMDTPHASAFFGVTVLWVFFGAGAFPAMVALGAFTARAGAFTYGRSDFFAFVLFRFCILASIQFMLSGNLDGLVGPFVTDTAMLTAIWFVTCR